MAETAEILNPEVAASNALVLVEAQPMEKLFERQTIDPILEKIALHCRNVPLDMSTELGRKAIASLAYKIAKTKTFIESQRTALVAAEKKRLAAIDAEGRRIRETLDSLKDEIRKPLTDWEDAEQQRIQGHEDMLLRLAATDFAGIDIQERITFLESFDLASLQEFRDRGAAILQNSLTVLRAKWEQHKKDEADRAELERLRKERAENERKEREAKIAADAAREAEERAKKAEADRKRAEERAKQAEADRDAAAERAAQAECDRIARMRQADADAEAKRAADRKHRGLIHTKALEAFVKGGLSAKTAKLAVELIAKGKIPAITVTY